MGGWVLIWEDWQMHEAVAAIAATGVSPIVRIAANEGWMVKREFFVQVVGGGGDMGADGVVYRSSGFRGTRDCCPASLHCR